MTVILFVFQKPFLHHREPYAKAAEPSQHQGTALALLQNKMSSEARVCLVYEEAHSLVPEFTSVASPSDREACNGTARVILQGRKFGLGCLVVSQRTANVTKTILNECNTVFAMRTFDETGKGVLGKLHWKRLFRIAVIHF